MSIVPRVRDTLGSIGCQELPSQPQGRKENKIMNLRQNKEKRKAKRDSRKGKAKTHDQNTQFLTPSQHDKPRHPFPFSFHVHRLPPHPDSDALVECVDLGLV